jgi:hypothetical protein
MGGAIGAALGRRRGDGRRAVPAPARGGCAVRQPARSRDRSDPTCRTEGWIVRGTRGACGRRVGRARPRSGWSEGSIDETRRGVRVRSPCGDARAHARRRGVPRRGWRSGAGRRGACAGARRVREGGGARRHQDRHDRALRPSHPGRVAHRVGARRSGAPRRLGVRRGGVRSSPRPRGRPRRSRRERRTDQLREHRGSMQARPPGEDRTRPQSRAARRPDPESAARRESAVSP